MKTITLQKDEKLSIETAKQLFGENYTADEIRLEIETYGPWSIIRKCSGLCVSQNFDTGEITVYGNRVLSDIRQSGYHLEGRVTIGGKKYTAFTSSHLFELENGHLIDVGIIFPRVEK